MLGPGSVLKPGALLQLVDGHGTRQVIQQDGVRGFVAGPLPRGSYTLRVQRHGGHDLFGPYELADGGDRDLGTLKLAVLPSQRVEGTQSMSTLDTHPSLAVRSLVFRRPRDGSPLSSLGFIIEDQQGLKVVEQRASPTRGGWRSLARLPLGSYRIKAQTPTGLRGTLRFSIVDLKLLHYAVEVEMHRP